MNVFLTRPLYNTPLLKSRLETVGISLSYANDNVFSPGTLVNYLKNVDALITHTEDDITPEIIAALPPTLKLIANYGIGFSNINIDAATKRKIQITNTPTEEAFHATAEATVALLLSVARRIPSLHTERLGLSTDPIPSFQRATAVSVRNKITGIIGLGRIGSKVATIMHNGFNNDIIYYDLCHNTGLDIAINAEKVSLPYLMQTADFICINMPLSEQTYNLISPEVLSLIKPTAILINTARAELLNEDALIKHLNNGLLYGAGLDVYSDKVNQIRASNIALTSHFANFEKEAYTAMTNLVADNVIGYLCNGKPVTPVNHIEGIQNDR